MYMNALYRNPEDVTPGNRHRFFPQCLADRVPAVQCFSASQVFVVKEAVRKLLHSVGLSNSRETLALDCIFRDCTGFHRVGADCQRRRFKLRLLKSILRHAYSKSQWDKSPEINITSTASVPIR